MACASALIPGNQATDGAHGLSGKSANSYGSSQKKCNMTQKMQAQHKMLRWIPPQKTQVLRWVEVLQSPFVSQIVGCSFFRTSHMVLRSFPDHLPSRVSTVFTLFSRRLT